MGIEGSFLHRARKIAQAAAIVLPALTAASAHSQQIESPGISQDQKGLGESELVARAFTFSIESNRRALLRDMHSPKISGDELKEIVFASTLSIPWDSLRNTRLDTHQLEMHTVMLSALAEGPIRVSRMNKASDLGAMADAAEEMASYGQGIPIGSELVLSNVHVLNAVAKKSSPDVWIYNDRSGRDIGVVRIPHKYFAPESVVALPTMKDSEIDGRFIVMTGIDIDWTATDTGASVNGRKTYGGIAFRLTRPLIEALFGGMPPEKEVQQYLQSFVVEVPVDQVLDSAHAADNVAGAAFHGMSASPVFVFKDGKYQFCAINYAILQVKGDDGHVHAFAIFYGPNALQSFFAEAVAPDDAQAKKAP